MSHQFGLGAWNPAGARYLVFETLQERMDEATRLAQTGFITWPIDAASNATPTPAVWESSDI